MPRQRSRDDEDDDRDDDDYQPRRRGRFDDREQQGSNIPYFIFGALALGVIVVAVVLVFVSRSRNARDQDIAARQLAEAEAARIAAEIRAAELAARQPSGPRPGPAPFAPPGPRGANWQKAIGKWQRPSTGTRDYPYLFEFRPDGGVSMTRIDQNTDMPRTDEATAQVNFDEAEHLSLTLHVHMGMYGYSFKVKPDGTLVLDDRTPNGLVFTRVK